MSTNTQSRALPSGTDFSQWYDDVIERAQLAEYGPVEGTMVIRPYGYSLWEQIRSELDTRIKACGAQNAYFPMFIPSSYLTQLPKLEGLAPELAVVTHAGGKELAEPAVVRFSSETIIGEFMAKWVQSYRDLPLLLNQWANVVRWESHHSLFMRTNEFLWQEGHTVHADQDGAREYARRIQRDVYEDVITNVMAVPALSGLKSRRQRSGALGHNTFTCEAMTGDGKALQMATSVEGGQTYAKAYDIQYVSRDGRHETAWTTSWGSSTRLIGGLIMVHGDRDGLRLPPVLAPTQVVVIPVGADALASAQAVAADLREFGLRVVTDDRTDLAIGERELDWTVKGVPFRLALSSSDLSADTGSLHSRFSGRETVVPLRELANRISLLIEEVQQGMLDAARVERDARITAVDSVTDAAVAAARGWAKLPASALGEAGEDELARSGISVRCLQRPDGSTPDNDNEPDLVAYVARGH